MKIIVLILILLIPKVFVDYVRELQSIEQNPHIYQSKGSVFKVRKE
jgi:hypothetical protein